MPRMPVTDAGPPARTRTECSLRGVSEYDGEYPGSPRPQPPALRRPATRAARFGAIAVRTVAQRDLTRQAWGRRSSR